MITGGALKKLPMNLILKFEYYRSGTTTWQQLYILTINVLDKYNFR